MAEEARKPATYQDVLDAPEHMVAEVLGGELHLHPRPKMRHTRAASSMGSSLHGAFDAGHRGPGGWIILYEPELHFGADIVVPDIAGWREERFPIPDEPDPPFWTVAPDWACEILSEGTARVDRMKKVPLYARESVGHVWLVEPVVRTIEVLRLRDSTYELVGTWGGDEAPFAIEPFEAVSFPPEAFWGRALGPR